MTKYNGYRNKDTWNAMLYINNDESLYRDIYKPVYKMIKQKANKLLVCLYIQYLLNNYIDNYSLDIDRNNIDYNELYVTISTDVFHETKNIN